jgi:hypothetical protein
MNNKVEAVNRLRNVLQAPDLPPLTAILHNVRLMGDEYDECYINLVVVIEDDDVTWQEERRVLQRVVEVEHETDVTIHYWHWTRKQWNQLCDSGPYLQIEQTGTIICQTIQLRAAA